MAQGTYRLLYDGGCRICTSVARWVSALDVRGRIHVQPIQDARDVVPGVAFEGLLSGYHMIGPDGRRATGGDAVPILLEALPLGGGLGRLIRDSTSLTRLTHRIYDIGARLRGALMCAVPAPRDASPVPCP